MEEILPSSAAVPDVNRPYKPVKICNGVSLDP